MKRNLKELIKDVMSTQRVIGKVYDIYQGEYEVDTFDLRLSNVSVYFNCNRIEVEIDVRKKVDEIVSVDIEMFYNDTYINTIFLKYDSLTNEELRLTSFYVKEETIEENQSFLCEFNRKEYIDIPFNEDIEEFLETHTESFDERYDNE